MPRQLGKKSKIHVALLVSLALHGFILLHPFHKQPRVAPANSDPVELHLELRVLNPPIPVVEPINSPSHAEEEVDARQHAPANLAFKAQVSSQVETETEKTKSNKHTPEAIPDQVSEYERTRLRRLILASQYVSEELVTTTFFPLRDSLNTSSKTSEFRFPVRPDMYALMEKPLPDLPFEYTPGLVNFSYDPGLRGEMQRFWDVITPEFEFTLGSRTQVHCTLVLLLPGCAWD